MSFALPNANLPKNHLQHVEKSSIFLTPTYASLNALPTKEDCSEAGSARHIVHKEVDTLKKSPKIFQTKPSFSRFTRGGIFSHSFYVYLS
jgi:hypothetical protein